MPEDLLDLNPYHSLPTLVDRDLVLYDSRVIMEYLDERFPHPPLMPVDPVARAQFRLALHRVERDWYPLVHQIEAEPDRKLSLKTRKTLRDTILQSEELFKVRPYFLSDEFSMVDATIAPVLWRLPHYEVELTSAADSQVRQPCVFPAGVSRQPVGYGTGNADAVERHAPCRPSGHTCCAPCTNG